MIQFLLSNRDALSEARRQLAKVIDKIGLPPFSSPELEKSWKYESERFLSKVVLVNDSVRKFNLIVPVMQKQLIPYAGDRELDKVLKNHKDYLTGPPSGSVVSVSDAGSGSGRSSVNETAGLGPMAPPSSYDNVILWGEVWKQIKEIFSWRKSQRKGSLS